MTHNLNDKQEKLKVLFFVLFWWWWQWFFVVVVFKIDTAVKAFGEIPHSEC